MATNIGFKKLKPVAWSATESTQLATFQRGLEADWTLQSLAQLRATLKKWLFANQKNRCAYCRFPIHENLGNAEVDHIIPKNIAPQLTYCRFNLILACKRCNHRKHVHNTTVLDELSVWGLGACPTRSADYMWVHPYIHNYDSHITLIEGWMYRPKSNSARGKAVIDECKLDEVKEVAARIRYAEAVAAADDQAAIFGLLSRHAGGTPEEDIAIEFFVTRPESNLDWDSIIAGIRNIRSVSLNFRRGRPSRRT